MGEGSTITARSRTPNTGVGDIGSIPLPVLLAVALLDTSLSSEIKVINSCLAILGAGCAVLIVRINTVDATGERKKKNQ